MAVLSVAAAGYSVTLADFQWEYVLGSEYGERNVNETEYGKTYREKTGVTQRHQQVRFVDRDNVFIEVRQLFMIAGRKGLPIEFDDGFGSVWTAEPPETANLTWVLDNRQEMVVLLFQQV